MPASSDARRLASIPRLLFPWFRFNRRSLPWRETSDPYRIWLSEMMLQQTQVATVIPYYQRFLARFPTVFALAAADLDEVLLLWSGLGYYARARNVHGAARMIVERFGGRFPRTVDELRQLPGVGPYSAAAVASIAFDVPAPLVDGNVARVLARLFNVRADLSTAPGRGVIWRLAERLLPRRHCGEFNQALMELGATVCLPGAAARCGQCPLRRVCAALAADRVAELPRKRQPRAPIRETHAVAAIENNGRWLMIQRPRRGLWGGLWELPSALLDGDSSARLARRIARRLIGARVTVTTRPFCRITHRLTHRTIEFVGHICRVVDVAHDLAPAHRWLNLAESETLALSTAMRRLIAALRLRWETSGEKTDAASAAPRRNRRAAAYAAASSP